MLSQKVGLAFSVRASISLRERSIKHWQFFLIVYPEALKSKQDR